MERDVLGLYGRLDNVLEAWTDEARAAAAEARERLKKPMDAENSKAIKGLIDDVHAKHGHKGLKVLVEGAGLSKAFVGNNASETKQHLHNLVSHLAISHVQTDF